MKFLRRIRFVKPALLSDLSLLYSLLCNQLMLLLLEISLFAKVKLLLPECFCEGMMQPLSDFFCSRSVVFAYVRTYYIVFLFG